MIIFVKIFTNNFAISNIFHTFAQKIKYQAMGSILETVWMIGAVLTAIIGLVWLGYANEKESDYMMLLLIGFCAVLCGIVWPILLFGLIISAFFLAPIMFGKYVKRRKILHEQEEKERLANMSNIEKIMKK